MKKNETTQANVSAAIEDQQWNDLKKQISGTALLFGGLLFAPFIFFIGLTYGIRAGIIVSLRKTLEMLKSWNG